MDEQGHNITDSSPLGSSSHPTQEDHTQLQKLVKQFTERIEAVRTETFDWKTDSLKDSLRITEEMKAILDNSMIPEKAPALSLWERIIIESATVKGYKTQSEALGLESNARWRLMSGAIALWDLGTLGHEDSEGGSPIRTSSQSIPFDFGTFKWAVNHYIKSATEHIQAIEEQVKKIDDDCV